MEYCFNDNKKIFNYNASKLGDPHQNKEVYLFGGEINNQNRFFHNSINTQQKQNCFQNKSSSIWTLREEDIILCELQGKFGNNWSMISKFLPGKNRVEVKVRYRSISRAVKRYWSEEENILLIRLFEKFRGIWNDEIAINFPTKSINAVKSHLKELLNGNKKEIYPIGSPNHIIASRPDLVKSISPPSNINSNQSLSKKYFYLQTFICNDGI